jgi:hypothetical protein
MRNGDARMGMERFDEEIGVRRGEKKDKRRTL